MPYLSLSLMGSLQITLDGHPITRFKSDKARALLAYLAVEAERPHRRDVLTGLLWPEMPDASARSNLRDLLANLRSAIGDREASPPFLFITRDTVQFNTASQHWLDVAVFTSLLATDPREESLIDRLEEAVALYHGSFLEGFSIGDSAAFEEWALSTREQLARQVSSALHRLAAAYEERGEYEQAQACARRQLGLEAWDEVAHQRLMRVLARSGQRSAALAQYQTCCRLLAEELGVEPSQETTSLYERIRDGLLEAPRTSPHPPEVGTRPPLFLEQAPVEIEKPTFVAREHQLAQLSRFLDLARSGRGQVVFVTGEAGSGKSALLQEFTRRALEADAGASEGSSQKIVIATGDCNAYTGVGDPYLPFREILALMTGDVEAQWAAGTMTREHVRRLWDTLPLAVQALLEAGPDLIHDFISPAALLERATTYASGRAEWFVRLGQSVEHRPVHPGMPGPQQSDLFEQYTRVLQVLARQVPLVLLVDDLQWADLGSISLLFHLGRHLAGNRILIVGAYRSEEVTVGRDGGRHPLEPVVNELQRDFGDIGVSLEETEGRGFVEALLDSEPNQLGIEFRDMLYRQTRGHPLFTTELLRGLQERGDLIQNAAGQWVEGITLNWEALPVRVEAAIRERIARLSEPLRTALQVASVEGEVFTAEVVTQILGTDERTMVQHLSSELDRKHRLVRAQAIERLGSRRLSRYRFRHILFQKYLYGSLDKVERVHLHEQVGTALEELYGDQAGEIAVQLAWHFQEAKIVQKAIHYLHQAGDKGVRISAYREASAHLWRALALLMTLPDTPERARQELDLRLTLGIATVGMGSFTADTETNYARARELSHQTGQTAKHCQALGEMAIFHYVRSEHRKGRSMAEEALSQALQAGDPLLVAWSRWHLGFILFGLGEFMLARDHLERVIAFQSAEPGLYSVPRLPGADAGLSSMAYLACSLWCLGYPDQALRHSEKALTLARELGHPFTLADVLSYGGCLFSLMNRDPRALNDHAQEMMRVSEMLPNWSAFGTWHCGVVAAMSGEVEEGIAQMSAGLAAELSMGKRLEAPRVLGALAEAQAKVGRPEEGLITLTEALNLVEATDERYWEAELHRLRAEVLLMQGDEHEAEASLHKAVDVARRQMAKSWELRSTTSLARLWRMQGRVDDARQTLAAIYGWFTEGFGTPDLKEAKTLLEELS